ncbi:MAG: hypothetical protein QOG85_2239 [Gaiellaceae bacterium]|nr:hypothetical protein [Gaiellaceae bacterium]
MTDPAVHTVVCMKPAQFAWTTCIENFIGYRIDLDPGPIVIVEPRDRDCEKFSKKRLDPMFRDTPCLREKIAPAKSRDPGNTIREKLYPGGSITLVGANSPAGLSGDSVRDVILDEVDRYPASAGAEGDPVDLAKQRNEAFWNRKTLMGSTPRDKETSRIEPAYLESDQRKLFAPCPDCGHHQVLEWGQVRWQKELEDGELVDAIPEDYSGAYTELPETAAYSCEACGSLWGDAKRWAASRWAEWRATRPFRGVAGFHANRLYASNRALSEIVQSFLDAAPYPERLKVWVNTTLAQTWVEKGERVEEGSLLARREPYGPQAPAGVVVVVASVDVQDDRLELELLGIGRGEEDWSLRHTITRGDPSTGVPWRDIDTIRTTPIQREDGVLLRIQAMTVDTGGHHSQAAYNFCRPRYAQRVWAIKGQPGEGRPIWPKKATKKNVGKTNLFLVGVDAAKEQIYARLRIPKPGPGYSHFPDDRDEEYFRQLTAEKLLTMGRKRRWVKHRTRNEALDLRVYAVAAFQGLVSSGLDLEREAQRLDVLAEALRSGARPPGGSQRRVRSRGVA